MARVVLTASADADTLFIIGDLAVKAGANVARRYNADFDALYVRLETFPESGAPRKRLGQHVRIAVVSPYKVIHEYIAADDTVVILRIVHGRRKITRHMLT